MEPNGNGDIDTQESWEEQWENGILPTGLLNAIILRVRNELFPVYNEATGLYGPTIVGKKALYSTLVSLKNLRITTLNEVTLMIDQKTGYLNGIRAGNGEKIFKNLSYRDITGLKAETRGIAFSLIGFLSHLHINLERVQRDFELFVAIVFESARNPLLHIHLMHRYKAGHSIPVGALVTIGRAWKAGDGVSDTDNVNRGALELVEALKAINCLPCMQYPDRNGTTHGSDRLFYINLCRSYDSFMRSFPDRTPQAIPVPSTEQPSKGKPLPKSGKTNSNEKTAVSSTPSLEDSLIDSIVIMAGNDYELSIDQYLAIMQAHLLNMMQLVDGQDGNAPEYKQLIFLVACFLLLKPEERFNTAKEATEIMSQFSISIKEKQLSGAIRVLSDIINARRQRINPANPTLRTLDKLIGRLTTGLATTTGTTSYNCQQLVRTLEVLRGKLLAPTLVQDTTLKIDDPPQPPGDFSSTPDAAHPGGIGTPGQGSQPSPAGSSQATQTRSELIGTNHFFTRRFRATSLPRTTLEDDLTTERLLGEERNQLRELLNREQRPLSLTKLLKSINSQLLSHTENYLDDYNRIPGYRKAQVDQEAVNKLRRYLINDDDIFGKIPLKDLINLAIKSTDQSIRDGKQIDDEWSKLSRKPVNSLELDGPELDEPELERSSTSMTPKPF
jgi:hypothetical protein